MSERGLAALAICAVATVARTAEPDMDDLEAVRARLEAYLGTVKNPPPGLKDAGWRVNMVSSDGPAAGAGIRAGDVIIGLDGFNVYDVAEYQYIRHVLHDLPTTASFTVLKQRTVPRPVPRSKGAVSDWLQGALGRRRPRMGGTMTTTSVEEVVIHGLLPYRASRFSAGNRGLTLLDVLEDLGTEIEMELRPAFSRFPRRPVGLLREWLASDPANRARVGWLAEFAALYSYMVKREWAEARAPSATIPVPYFAKLARFYLSIARRNRGGERPPDWKAHGVSLEFYVFNYPYPVTFKMPPLGEVELADENLARLIKLRHDDVVGSNEARLRGAARYVHRHTHTADDYLACIRRALAVAYNERLHLGCSIWRKERRAKVVAGLEAYLAKDDGDALVYALSLIPPYVIDNRADEAFALLDRIRAKSPYLAYLGAYWMNSTVRYWERWDIRRRAIEYHGRHFYPPPQKNSLFFKHVIERDRRIASRYAREWGNRRLSNLLARLPILVVWALSQERTSAEEARLLDAEIAKGDFAARRDELFRRALRLSKLDFYEEDYERLKRLNRDGKAYGKLFEALGESMYWENTHNLIDPHIPPWVKSDVGKLAAKTDEATYPALWRELRAMPWKDAAAVERTAQSLFHRFGWSVSTLALADALAEHGHEKLAKLYREKVLRYHVSQAHEVSRIVAYRRRRYSPFFLHALRAFCHSKATCAPALKMWQQYKTDRRKDPVGQAAHLYVATAHLNLGHLGEAIAALIASATIKLEQNTYFFAGRCCENADEYRAHLLRRLASHPRFTPKMKQQIVDSPLDTCSMGAVHDLFGKPLEEVF